MKNTNKPKSIKSKAEAQPKREKRVNFGMKEFSGEGPALERSKIVDGGNLEDAQADLVNEDSPILAENFVDDSDGEN